MTCRMCEEFRLCSQFSSFAGYRIPHHIQVPNELSQDTMSDQVLLANENAICCIHTKNYNAAAALLAEGMAIVEQEYRNRKVAHGEFLDATNKMMDCEEASRLEAEDFDAIAMSSCKPSKENHVHPGGDVSPYVMYCNAFEIPRDVLLNRRRAQGDEDYHFTCGILLYNYGLSLHLQGISQGIEDNLEEALFSYEMALGLVALAGRRPLVDMLELALLNNCGHIHRFFLSTSQVHICLERMQALLQHVTNGWSEVLPEALASFAFNLIYNAPQYARPAPAA